MDPDFLDHINDLEWAIDTLEPGEVAEIRRGEQPVAVLLHPHHYRDLLDQIEGAG